MSLSPAAEMLAEYVVRSFSGAETPNEVQLRERMAKFVPVLAGIDQVVSPDEQALVMKELQARLRVSMDVGTSLKEIDVESLFGTLGLDGEDAQAFNLFQKSFKYGLPDSLAISAFEAGFADREVASRIRDVLLSAGYPHAYFGLALRESRSLLDEALKQFPSYFNEVLATL